MFPKFLVISQIAAIYIAGPTILLWKDHEGSWTCSVHHIQPSGLLWINVDSEQFLDSVEEVFVQVRQGLHTIFQQSRRTHHGEVKATQIPS